MLFTKWNLPAPDAKNSFEEPEKVVPKDVKVTERGGRAFVEMPPLSILTLRTE